MVDQTLLNRAEAGDSEAQYQVAFDYSTEKNFVEARKWYEQLATLERTNRQPRPGNLSSAISKLGAMNILGVGGFTKDKKAAFKLFEEANSLNHMEGKVKLATMYVNGWGVKSDRDKGIALAKEAANSGNKMAQYNLGCWHMSSPDPTETLNYFKLAAEGEGGFPNEAYFQIGYKHEDHRKYTLAIEAYKLSAQAGNTSAMRAISDIHLFSPNERLMKAYDPSYNLDQKEGFRYAKMAAQAGDTQGMKCTAECYEKGIGTDKSPTDAKYWRDLASGPATSVGSMMSNAWNKWMGNNNGATNSNTSLQQQETQSLLTSGAGTSASHAAKYNKSSPNHTS